MASETAYGTGRARLLDAARACFGERGYVGATTREIADRAGVTEPMIFRHFGSKAALFEAATVAPVVGFIDGYVAEWRDRDHAVVDAIAEARGFFERLVQVLAENRELLLAILAAGEFDKGMRLAGERVTAAFGRVLDLFQQMVDVEFTMRNLRTPDRPALVRVIIGLLVSAALHPDWLDVGDGKGQVSRARLLDEAARVIVEGLR